MSQIIAPDVLEKEQKLKDIIKGYGSIAVAYSGGVDSTYLADVAHETIGDHAWMLIADTPSLPRAELDDAVTLAEGRGWRYAIIETKEFDNEEFLSNAGRRCYVCKNELFSQMKDFANEHGIVALAYGETADDVADPTRYGAIAAKEQGIVAPLQQAGMKKDDIRVMSRRREQDQTEKVKRKKTPKKKKSVERADEEQSADGLRGGVGDRRPGEPEAEWIDQQRAEERGEQVRPHHEDHRPAGVLDAAHPAVAGGGEQQPGRAEDGDAQPAGSGVGGLPGRRRPGAARSARRRAA